MTESEDLREIEQLLALSAHAADRRDFELLRSLYAEGAFEDHGEFKGGVDDYVEWAKGTVAGMESAVHLYLRPIIAVSSDVAQSESVLQVTYRLRSDPPMSTIGLCRLFDHYARTPIGWRFTRRAMCFDWMQSFQADPVQVPAGTLMGATDRSDPFYSEVPLVAQKLREFAA